MFIAFGASASAVGSFLLRNRNLLAPVAGALIVLFGLHLVGWLAKISVRAGLVIGAVAGSAGAALSMRPGLAGASLKAVHFYAAVSHFFARPGR